MKIKLPDFQKNITFKNVIVSLIKRVMVTAKQNFQKDTSIMRHRHKIT